MSFDSFGAGPAGRSNAAPGGNETSTFKYDLVGNRTQKTQSGQGTDIYVYNDRYELTDIHHGLGGTEHREYDGNGNTTSKSYTPDTIITIHYSNTSDGNVNFHAQADGNIIGAGVLTPTNGGTVQFMGQYHNDLTIAVDANDAAANSGRSATIKYIEFGRGGKAEVIYASVASGVGVTPNAGDSSVSGFGDEAGDGLSMAISLPDDPLIGYVNYNWDSLNRLTDVGRSVYGQTTNTANFQYFTGSHGWQIREQTVTRYDGGAPHSDNRQFAYGLGGEVLSETIDSTLTRNYANSGVDHVLWSKDAGTGATNFWLNDANGSVFGFANQTGDIVERQTMNSLGQVKITDATSGARTGLLTVYQWESGKTRPRRAALAKLVAVKGIGRRDALRRLEALNGSGRPALKPRRKSKARAKASAEPLPASYDQAQ